MAIYISKYNGPRSFETRSRLDNQIVISGTDPVFPVANGTFYLEMLQVDGAGTVTIKDGDGVTICTGVGDFSTDYSPLKCDKGIEFVGDVAIAKGFFVDGVFNN